MGMDPKLWSKLQLGNQIVPERIEVIALHQVSYRGGGLKSHWKQIYLVFCEPVTSMTHSPHPASCIYYRLKSSRSIIHYIEFLLYYPPGSNPSIIKILHWIQCRWKDSILSLHALWSLLTPLAPRSVFFLARKKRGSK